MILSVSHVKQVVGSKLEAYRCIYFLVTFEHSVREFLDFELSYYNHKLEVLKVGNQKIIEHVSIINQGIGAMFCR